MQRMTTSGFPGWPAASLALALALTSTLAGCGDDGSATSETTGPGESDDEIGDSGTSQTTTPGESETDDGDEESETDDESETEDDGGLKLDVSIPDMPGGGGGNPIPETCAEAEMAESSVGCEFFAVELDNFSGDNASFAIVAANVQQDGPAEVVVESFDGAQWTPVVPAAEVPSMDAHVFLVAKPEIDGSGVAEHGSFRVTSDVPIAAYQFNRYAPHATSDASLLLPTTAWDTLHRAVSYERQMTGPWLWPSYFAVVSAQAGTVLEVDTIDAVAAGPGVPAAAAGANFPLMIDEADYVQVAVPNPGDDPTGTRIDSGEIPVGVFGGTACTVLVDQSNSGACDHLEEMLPGVRLWGSHFVAARFPVRAIEGEPEASIWQIVASEDDTTVSFSAGPMVEGVPAAPVSLDAGEQTRFVVRGPHEDPGDFIVDADKPILLVNYSLSGDELFGEFGNDSPGDPAMIVLPPIDQYLPRYVVLVPDGWDPDVLSVVRPNGLEVLLDGVAIDEALFVPVGGDHEVARIEASDGVHTLEAAEGIAVTVVGYRSDDSYGYPGGLGTGVINPEPQG